MSATFTKSTQTRAYRSPLRDGQAAKTRARILDAAADLFATLGYGGTSLAKIAEQAGVSVETVKASGAKRDLLLASFENSFAGMAGIESLADHAPVVQITADGDNVRYLAGIVHFVAESNRRSSRLWLAFFAAAAADTELGAKFAGLQARRRIDILVLVDELRSRGIVAAEAPRETQADAISFVLSPEGYNQLVHDAGWSQQQYEHWLVRALPAIAALAGSVGSAGSAE